MIVEDETFPEAAVVGLSGRLAARVIDGKAILVVVDTQRLHTLNETGTFLFERLPGKTVGELADALSCEFEVDRDVALADTRAFLSELLELRSIEVRAP